MTIRYRPKRSRRFYALILAVLTLWLISVTAVSHSAASALSAIASQADLAVALLRLQLADGEGSDDLPAAAAFAISQSPLLLSQRGAISDLRRSEEQEDDTSPEQTPHTPEQTSPIPEEPVQPDIPLVIIDNGVAARTLIPTSPDGYVVTGDVYIDNRSDKTVDPSLFDGSFDAHLTSGGEPQVLIVHTHGSEAYTMPPGQEYIPSGDCRTTEEAFSVVRVGEEIAAVLEQAGIRVLHDKTLHDYPRYSGAYERSLAAVERYLERYPSIRFVLDVHRDAISDSSGTMYKVISGVAGLNAAQMSFVIGTDGGGLSHPRWQENLKLAAAIQQTLCTDYPSLMRPITVRNSRYNQHTTTGSLLVEMGAAGNSLDEALLSARLLGDAIVRTMLLQETVPPAASVIN